MKLIDIPYFCQKQFSGTNAGKVHTRKHIPFPPSRDSIRPTSLTPPRFHSHSFASSLLDPELRTTAIWTRIFCSTFSHCYSLSGRSGYGLLQQHLCPVILEINACIIRHGFPRYRWATCVSGQSLIIRLLVNRSGPRLPRSHSL